VLESKKHFLHSQAWKGNANGMFAFMGRMEAGHLADGG
jgi:hypothetical protein